jgi:hypothetical protein
MATNKNVIELDFPKLIEASASHTVSCDQCGSKLGDRYSNKRNSVSIPLKKATASDDEDGYDAYVEMHFCNEDHLREHLIQRAKGKKK